MRPGVVANSVVVFDTDGSKDWGIHYSVDVNAYEGDYDYGEIYHYRVFNRNAGPDANGNWIEAPPVYDIEDGVDYIRDDELLLNLSLDFYTIPNSENFHFPQPFPQINFTIGYSDIDIRGSSANDVWFGTLGVNDTISGQAGSDELHGGLGDDAIYGGSQSDRLFGDNNSDTISGGKGSDVMDGGKGFDLLSYAESKAGVRVDLGTGLFEGGFASGDTAFNFEGIIGSRHADMLTGSDGKDFIDGGAGSDTIFGGLGKDVVQISAQIGKGSIDKIIGFDGSEDNFNLSTDVFVGLKNGKLESKFFNGGNRPVDKSDIIIYDREAGTLLFDADGSRKQFEAVVFAKLEGVVSIDHTDLIIV